MPKLNSDRVQRVINQVIEIARDERCGAAVAVTDPSGRLLGALRDDGGNYLGMEIAIKKAATSAALGVPTQQLARMAEDGLMTHVAEALEEMVIIPGGFPIFEAEEVVGGVGIAAGHYARDQEIGEKAFPGQG